MENSNNNKYSNIISIPYVKSTRHKQMSLNDRAAQFAPFSALSGYEESISEVRRTTTSKKKLSQEAKDIISAKLQFIMTNNLQEEVLFTYFIPDERKQGGKYVDIKKKVKRVDEVMRTVYFTDRTSINIDTIYDIRSYSIDVIFVDL
jgi:hypothetical protein